MLETLSWWVAAQVLGLAALPLAWRLLGHLPSRGYPYAKAMGLLLVSFVLWLGAIFHLLPNDLGGVVVSLALVCGVSLWMGREGLSLSPTGARPLLAWLRSQRRLILTTELLFALALAAWAVFRAYNPDIAGTEKPMEFAFMNGVLRSRFFPPQDPWLSGYGISYYYFGYVMLGVLIRLTGVASEVGFNLGVAFWFALTLTGAFGLVYDLVARGSTGGRAIRWGLVGALFTGVMGNLEAVIDSGYQRGFLPARFISWINIKQLTDTPPTGNLTGGFWWWWRASRVIHDVDLAGNSVEVIDEFPFFSFLLGDMHPHVLALPFVLLAIAAALNLFLGALRASEATGKAAGVVEEGSLGAWIRATLADLTAGIGLGPAGITLYAVMIGALGFLNTWDFPIYVVLAALAWGAGRSLVTGLSLRVAGQSLGVAGILGVAGFAAYLPFYIGFQSQLGGVLPNLLFPSRFSQFFVMFGPFLVIAVLFLMLLAGSGAARRTGSGGLKVFPFALLLPLLAAVVLSVGSLISREGASAVRALLNDPNIAGALSQPTLGGLAGLAVRLRLTAPWTWLALASVIAWIAGAIGARLAQRGSAAPDTERDPSDLFALLMMGLAFGLALAVEFVYLRDLFGTRMNTVFKLYYQAWILLAVASAFGLSRLWQRSTRPALRVGAMALPVVLVLAGLWYPAAAVPSKADQFKGKPTLDGLAYLRNYNAADATAIAWLRKNALPGAVVAEASGGSYSGEGAGRVSMSTGNPTLLGWDFHERQWRGKAYDEVVAGRPEALNQIYRAAPANELLPLLSGWGVDYVYVGALERTKFEMGATAIERLDQALDLVYDQDGVRIYAR